MATMKACRYVASDGKIEVVDVPVPASPCQGHVIVKIAYAGTCGSDLSALEGKIPVRDGVVMGHEVAGSIHQTGDKVTNVKVGDHVVVNPLASCNGCHFCHRGMTNMCSVHGLQTIFGGWRDGGWREFCEVPACQVVPIPDGLSLKQAVLCEPMSCVLNAWNKMDKIPADAKILVMGSGIGGLLFASLFHFKGYRDITVTSRTERRQKIAAQIGFPIKTSSLEEVGEKFVDPINIEHEGFDVIVEASGSVEVFEKSLPWLRGGGKMIVYGVPPPDKKAAISPFDIIVKEIRIYGVFANCFSFADAVATVKAMSESGYLLFDKLNIEMYKFGQISKALDALKNKTINKAVLEP